MKRRLVAVFAAIMSTSFVVLPLAPVDAASASGEFTEAIARKQVVTSPQTSGPNNGVLSWGLDRIDQRTVVTSSRSYNFSETGSGVTAYVLDSGVNASHPEFESRVLDGWSYRGSSTALSSYSSALAANVADPNTGIPACPNDGTHAVDPTGFDKPSSPDSADKGKLDNDGHGTHVAGIVGGGTTGVAKNVSIIPVRSLDSCGNGTTTMIVEGLAWILADHDAGEKAVLNLSVGFDNRVTSVDNAITALMNEGIVVMAAAGNDSLSACGTTPAATPGTISIGSTDRFDVESSFTNYGDCVDILAPGSSIQSTFPYDSGVTNTYVTQSGTSMATPFVTGAVARMLSTLNTAPTDWTTGPTVAWTWLRDNATTNAITYYNSSRNPQTPNRLLYVPAVPVSVTQLQALPLVNGAEVSWQNVLPNTTYVVTTSPVTTSCTVVAAGSCTLSGLSGGVTYTVSVVGSNADGVGAASITTVTPSVPAPLPPSDVVAKVLSKSITLTWSAVSSATPVTYIVTSSSGSAVCTTTSTSCTVSGLTNGKEYTFSVASQASGTLSSASSASIVARPGFTVVKTTVAKKSKTSLTGLVKTISNGKKTWSESGPCSISGSRLVAPSKVVKCVLTLKVAKTSKYPAMSTKVTIAVK